MNTSLLKTINWIITNYGESILEYPDRLKVLFKTHAKNEPAEERRAFGRCIEMGYYKTLKKAKTINKRIKVKNNLVNKLHRETGISLQQCNAAIELLDTAIHKNTTQKPVRQTNFKNYFNKLTNKKNQIINKINLQYRKIKIANSKKLIVITAGIAVLFLFSLIAINGITKQQPTPTETNITIEDDILELQRIIEHQEALSERIEQLRNQIEDNLRNQINNPQMPQQGINEQNQLIERLNNELLMEVLVTKREGMRDISGNILVNIIPINYRNRSFRMNPDNLRNTVNEGINLIRQHAREYNVSINFDVVYDNSNNGRFLTLQNATEAINLYRRFENTRYNFTVNVFVVDTVERSYITRRADYSHAIMWFRGSNGHSSSTLVHEIYHAFGAEDLYYEQGVVPREVEEIFRTLVGNSIMLSSQRFTGIDPINAWLIGWNMNPQPWFAWFVDRRDTSNLNFFVR